MSWFAVQIVLRLQEALRQFDNV